MHKTDDSISQPSKLEPVQWGDIGHLDFKASLIPVPTLPWAEIAQRVLQGTGCI